MLPRLRLEEGAEGGSELSAGAEDAQGPPRDPGFGAHRRGPAGWQGGKAIVDSQAWPLEESGFKDLASSCVPQSSQPNAFLMADAKSTHTSL